MAKNFKMAFGFIRNNILGINSAVIKMRNVEIMVCMIRMINSELICSRERPDN